MQSLITHAVFLPNTLKRNTSVLTCKRGLWGVFCEFRVWSLLCLCPLGTLCVILLIWAIFIWDAAWFSGLKQQTLSCRNITGFWRHRTPLGWIIMLLAFQVIETFSSWCFMSKISFFITPANAKKIHWPKVMVNKTIFLGPITFPLFQYHKKPGGRLNKKDGLTRYGNSHVKDKTS